MSTHSNARPDQAGTDVPSGPSATRPLYNRVVFVLSLLGLIVSSALWYWHTHAHPIVDMPCGESHGCEAVAESPYAFFPVGSSVPVALYGVFGYLGIAVLSVLRTIPGTERRDRSLLHLIAAAAGAGTLFALWLTSLELFTIHAICRWCMTSQGLILGITITAGLELLHRRGQRGAS
jgi:uncharacterized membrane protein